MSVSHGPRGIRAALALGVLAGAFGAVACSGAEATPADRLEPGSTLALPSKHGLTESRLSADGNIAEGPNNAFLVDFDPGNTDLVDAEAFMPVHGHGSPAKIRISATDSGFRLHDVVFSMGGLWNVTLEVTVGGEPDTVEFSIDVP